MAVKLSGLGFRPLPEAEPVPVAKMKPATTVEVVRLPIETKFTLILNCPRRLVPVGIQVLPASGGCNNVANEPVVGARRFRKVKVDLDGLMSRCIVDSINVRERESRCRIYINCTIGLSAGRGFHFWHGLYEKFVRKELMNVWDRAVLKPGDGRTSLELKSSCEGVFSTKIDFAIAR